MATIYTLAGVMTSAIVGGTLGALGGLVSWGELTSLGMLVAVVVGAIAAAREVGLVSVRFPQPRRQTKEYWGKVFDRRLAQVFGELT
ncbi:MAG TPA: hypothetical protein VNJ46_02730 [Gaiellaceae bacterium]|nr:hypothetical protein [Gaiellaceae bacterium]